MGKEGQVGLTRLPDRAESPRRLLGKSNEEEMPSQKKNHGYLQWVPFRF
jgi:hypothetical protein